MKTNRFTISRLVLALAVLALAFQAGLALWNYARLAGVSLAFPYPLDYGEGPLLDQVLRMGAGENIYDNDFSTPPYTISNYPPVYLISQVPFAWIFGPALWYGRVISLAGALLTALMIGLTLFSLTGDRLASIAGGLLFLTVPYTQFWSLLTRIDLLALGLSWAALYVIVRFHDHRDGIQLGAVLLAAAVFTRQSYALAAPFAAFCWLLFARQFRPSFRLALLTGGITLALFLLINILTGGGFFLNIVTANVNPFKWDTVLYHRSELYRNAFVLIFLSAFVLVLGWINGNRRALALALPYMIGAALSALTIGKDGSNVNYLLELDAALCLAGGVGLAWAGRSPWTRALVVVLLTAQIGLFLSWSHRDFNNRILDRVSRYEQVDQLMQVVRQTDGIILADEYMALIPLAGKRLYYQPFEFKMLKEGKVWNESPFLAQIRNKEFSLILLYQPPTWPAVEARWTPGMINTIKRNYTSKGEYDFTQTVFPRP